MIVRAVACSGEVLPGQCRDHRVGIDSSTAFPLTIGRLYAVFAVTVYLGVAWYYVINDDGHSWPTWAPAPLFDIVDGRMPASWKIGYFRFTRDEQYPIISFPEWADDHAFYERLVDGDGEAQRTFVKRRKEIEDLS